jgi:aerobic-type carbon monoxide dehydrogenase small subunit (CoxS/CutS family)
MSDLSRRNFLKGVGVGAIATSALPAGTAAPAATSRVQGVLGPDAVAIKLAINGKDCDLKVEPRVTLLDALRNHLDLTGAKKVCDRATCGACTVLVDGKPIYGCTMLAIEAQGRKIETVESLASGEKLAAIQAAFVKNDALQCGFCTPGFVVACESIVRKNPNCTREQALDGLGGNLCRCGTYVGIAEAVVEAAKTGGAK